MLWSESGDEFDFALVQVELTTVKVPVHVRVGQENLGRAAFDDDVEDFRLPKLVQRLSRENHCGVLFPPSLERLDDVALDARVLQKQPSLINEKCLEDVADLRIADRGVCPVQDVKEKRLQDFGILIHPLKVEALETGERNRVFSVIEDEIELSASGPLCEPVRETPVERIRENAQRAKCWLDFVQILNLVVKIAFLCGRQF